MLISIKLVFIISFLFYPQHWVESLEIPIITNIQDVIGLAHDIGDLVSGNIPFSSLFVTQVNPLDQVLQKINNLDNQLESMDLKLDNLLETIIARLPVEDNVNADIRDLQEHINRIDSVYEDFLAYSSNISAFRNDTIKEFVTIVTSAKVGNIPDIVTKIFNIIVSKKSALNRMGLLENLLSKQILSNPLELCDSPISFQHRLLQIYNLISITETKAFLMTSFAYKVHNEFAKVNSKGEMDRALSSFVMRLDQYLTEFRKNMEKASREIFRCDPEELTNKENTLELEGLFTAIVVNEWQDHVPEPCDGTCSSLTSYGLGQCYNLYDQHYCNERKCRGIVHDCATIGGDVDLCEYPAASLKRYEYVRSYSNGMYGKWSHCPNSTYKKFSGKIHTWVSCDTCLCRCEEYYESSPAIRTFSLREQLSNIDENKVVSDVKFTLKDHMMHIQIEESPLLPLGRLDRNESAWVPLEDFLYLPNVNWGGWVKIEDGQNINMTKDEDFAYITREQRSINLDEISGGPNTVVTGVRLRYDYYKFKEWHNSEINISPLQLEIQVTPYDYTSGQLTPTEENPSVWLTPKTQPKVPQAYAKPRKQLKTGDRGYQHDTIKNPPNVEPNQFISFIQSNLWEDVGQSTIPLIDARPAAPMNPLLLDGIGVMYRGHPRYGGFLALKAMSQDLVNIMDASMTSEQREFYSRHFRKPVSNPPPKVSGKRITGTIPTNVAAKRRRGHHQFDDDDY